MVPGCTSFLRESNIPRLAVTLASGSPVLWLPKPYYVGRAGAKVTVICRNPSDLSKPVSIALVFR